MTNASTNAVIQALLQAAGYYHGKLILELCAWSSEPDMVRSITDNILNGPPVLDDKQQQTHLEIDAINYLSDVLLLEEGKVVTDLYRDDDGRISWRERVVEGEDLGLGSAGASPGEVSGGYGSAGGARGEVSGGYAEHRQDEPDSGPSGRGDYRPPSLPEEPDEAVSLSDFFGWGPGTFN